MPRTTFPPQQFGSASNTRKQAELSPLCPDFSLWPEPDKTAAGAPIRTTSAPQAPTTRSLRKEAATTEVQKQMPYLSLRHDVQILLIDGEGHVSKDWAPVLENCHHFVLNSTMGRTICSDLEEAQTHYR